ncbi:uncharacterized protein LOC110427572 isoform X2 [Herrania umbratica]|uniref:Uncharacterized protein LOC110427572 isoform X2 n=1 Tax=Herrania umbratica TaxID=108875 RepID=A0A6J1BHN6_9ROSI|nr:uncharacterized protein LOC110427572 isoform X2 [Herrania umbratica]
MHALGLLRSSRSFALAKKACHGNQRKRLKNLNTRMRRLRSDMEEISEEQKRIKEGQRQVREKFETIELECEQLRKETNLIMQQSANTQIRLAIMFRILKARENQDFDQAAKLTCALRALIAKESTKECCNHDR